MATLEIDKKYIDEALQIAIDEIKQNFIPLSVIDDIKAEIHATAEMHEDGDYYLRDKWIDEIIDKHISGKGN